MRLPLREGDETVAAGSSRVPAPASSLTQFAICPYLAPCKRPSRWCRRTRPRAAPTAGRARGPSFPATGASGSRGSPASSSPSRPSPTGTPARQASGVTLSVTGWHTGALGKLVFFIGLATLILEALREAGIELPGDRAREPRPHRVRVARDDLRPHPPHLDPRHVLRDGRTAASASSSASSPPCS